VIKKDNSLKKINVYPYIKKIKGTLKTEIKSDWSLRPMIQVIKPWLLYER
jgi:hypothetical protein